MKIEENSFSKTPREAKIKSNKDSNVSFKQNKPLVI